MENTLVPQSQSASSAEVSPTPDTQPEHNAYIKLRRIALIATAVLIFVILLTLLYLNGKSLYDHGL